MPPSDRLSPWLAFALRLTLSLGAGYLLALFIHRSMRDSRSSLAPSDSKKREAMKRMLNHLLESYKRAGRKGPVRVPALNRWEEMLLSDVVFPHQIEDEFKDMGGLRTVKEQMYEAIVLPLTKPQLFAKLQSGSKLVKVPTGVLLYGPPGTGKTMTARALAKSTQATFINVRPSMLQQTYYGESQKVVRAVFSLAHKFAPSIIFVDECDTLFRRRGGGEFAEHEVSNSIKAEWMALWDGLISSAQQTVDEQSLSSNSTASSRSSSSTSPVDALAISTPIPTPTPPPLPPPVVVLACTNRPFDLDDAFMRRLPRSFFFPLPNADERRAVLRILLRNERLSPKLKLDRLVQLTEGYSSSDIKELCQTAAMIPIRAVIKQDKDTMEELKQMMGEEEEEEEEKESSPEPSDSIASPPPPPSSSSTAASSSPSSSAPRPLRWSDFMLAYRSIRPTACGSMLQMLEFERKQRAAQPMLNLTTQELDEDERDEEDEENEDVTAHASRADTVQSPPSVGSQPLSDDDDDELYK